jgi:threonine dehydrogenase-like Zn-dependent dehydrogenase
MSEVMKALVFDGERIRLEERPKPEPAEGEALVGVRTAGICNTDLEILAGYMGYAGVPGHEFVGTVEACANEALRGGRVVGEINGVCHSCRFCEMGMPRHCLRRTVLGIQDRDGAFAEYLTLPEENLHLVPEGVPDEVAVFTEPVAAAFRILEQIDIDPEDRVVVLGDGKLGLLIAQVLALKTPRVVCAGKHPWKLELVERLGVETVLASEPIERGADVVVEATGTAVGVRRALELVRPEGAVVLKTTVAGETPLPLALPVVNEVRMVGSRCGPFRPALEALALGTVDVGPMVTASYGLEEGREALEYAKGPGVMKVLLRIGG